MNSVDRARAAAASMRKPWYRKYSRREREAILPLMLHSRYSGKKWYVAASDDTLFSPLALAQSRPNVFDPAKEFDDGRVRMDVPDTPSLHVADISTTGARLWWEAPAYDGGDEIYLYTVELATYDVKWQPHAEADPAHPDLRTSRKA